MTNHGCFGRFAKCKIIGTFHGLFPLLVSEPIISRLLVDKSEKTRVSCIGWISLHSSFCMAEAFAFWGVRDFSGGGAGDIDRG